MVNKSANINKMNNDLSPQIIEKKPQHVALEIQVLAWDRYKNVVGLNINGIPDLPSCGGIKHQWDPRPSLHVVGLNISMGSQTFPSW